MYAAGGDVRWLVRQSPDTSCNGVRAARSRPLCCTCVLWVYSKQGTQALEGRRRTGDYAMVRKSRRQRQLPKFFILFLFTAPRADFFLIHLSKKAKKKR